MCSGGQSAPAQLVARSVEMREFWKIVCACAALTAGGVFASDELTPMDKVSLVAGSSLVTKVRTNMDAVQGCYLVPPNGDAIQFMPKDFSDEKFQLEDPIVLYGCQVNIQNLDENDTGIWEIYYTTEDGFKKGSQYYDITVTSQDAEGDAESGTASEDKASSLRTELATIPYGAKIGINVTISLSRQEFDEECYLQTPQGEVIKLEDVQINGVNIYLTSTNFVSCRVIIGPMEENLLGTWTLCGRHTEGDVTYERCQPGSISWAIPDPSGNWASTVHSGVSHVVSFGFSLAPQVRGTGNINTCHVVTPAGEDIALTAASDYPGLSRVINSRDANSCNVTFGPINANFIGDWALYGTYVGNANTGFNVVRLPMNFFLYDEENPYNQAYNITTLTAQTHVVSVGSTIVVTVSGSGVRNGCEFITNTEEHHDETSVANAEGVAFVNNNNADCRLQIGPITQDMFGDWLLIGKFQRLVFNEFQQPFQLIKEDPANPIPDTIDRQIEYLDPQNFDSSFGQSHEVTTSTGRYLVTQSCHIRTPDNLQYILREGWVRPGVEGIVGSGISCGVRVHVNDEDAIGEWMLIARIAIRGTAIERRIKFTINVEEQTVIEGSLEGESIEEKDPRPTMLSTINYGARLGVNITITLSKKEYDEECYLQTPQGDVFKFEDVQLTNVHVYPTSTNFVSCRVVIGPLDESLLGSWTLCGKHVEGESVRERCQPGSITNPIENWAATTHATFDHVVHYGFSLAPIVRGTGTLNTCHVITPHGEDIALTPESDYPGLELIEFFRDTTACSVNIGDIDANFLGNWVLYGTYNSVAIGFNVVTLPMTFFLYDVENPYSQAYNVTQLDPETHVLIEGLTVTIAITGSGTTDACEFVTNTGEVHDQATVASVPGVTFVNNNNAACRLQVGPVTKDMFGEWRLIGKFSRNNVQFNELQLPFSLIEEDPANPIPDDIDRTIEYLNTEHMYTSFGNSHSFSTATGSRMSTDSCHLRTPNHLQYILRSGMVQDTFQAIAQSNMSCGVQVHVNDVDAIGEWMLIARINVQGARIERRLPFIIHVEEEVNAIPNTVTVAEGNDLYMRLANSTELFETCVLIGPFRNNADRDENFVDTCGFIVRDVTLADAGTWEIEYGSRIKYRAFIRVDVTARFENHDSSLVWTNDAPLNVTIGPVDAIFCKVEDPSGLIVFQGFGRCNIVLDRVTSVHAGVWKMTIGTAGRVRADTHEFLVKLDEAAPTSQVITSVETEKPSVMLSCQVETEHEVTACKFRDPSGKVLLASQGVGEDRYSFHGTEVSLRSEVSSRECGLRITNPEVGDLGLWRCAMETEKETYYGFLTVLCPWAMQQPEVAAAVVSVPSLTSESDSIKSVEGNAVIMRCSVQSAIRYCYFRAQNGTVFNVSPGSREWFSYAGAGLDAGECSIRFPGLQARDSGRWSCHVGFNEHSEPEQLAHFNVHIDAEMVAEQYHKKDGLDTLVVRAQVHSQRALEYCRFVRIDGQGFTSDNTPSGYEDHSLLANGKCEIRIPHPSILQQHPWTVVAKMVGYHAELSRSTEHTLTLPEEETEKPELGPEHHEQRETNVLLVLWCVLTASMVVLIAALLLGPKKNREWASRRAVRIRSSLRRSLIKQPLPEDQNPPTPIAA